MEKNEFRNFKERLVVTKELFYNEGSMFGAYGFRFEGEKNPLIKVHPQWNNFSIGGEVQQLTEGKAYTVVFKESFDERKQIDTYTFVRVESDGIQGREAHTEFINEILTEKQANGILNEFPNNENIVYDILEDKIDLTQVKGIKNTNAMIIKEKLSKVAVYSEAIIKLSPIGVGIKPIVKLVEHFGSPEKLIQVVDKDIYRLTEVNGFGFKRVDKYALELGFKKDDKRRIESGAIFVIEELSSSGDTKIGIDLFDEKLCDILEIESVDDELFSRILKNDKIFYDNGFITLKEFREEEMKIVEHLRRLRDNYKPVVDEEDIETVIKLNEDKLGFKFNKEQREAIFKASKSGIFILDGRAGSGKCIQGDSLVLSDQGMIKIKDFPKHFKYNNGELKSNIVSYDIKGNRVMKETSHWYDMGVQPTKEIQTNFGRFIEGTYEHPLLTVNSFGELEYKEIQDIEEGDILVSSINDQLYGNDKTVSEDMAYALGLLTGDGTLNGINYEIKSYSIYLTNQTPEIFEKYKEIIYDNFGINVRTEEDGNTYNHVFANKNVVLELRDKYGLSLNISKYKEIPEPILKSPKNVLVKFLQGLFDTDGSMTYHNIRGKEKYGFEFSTASKQMYQQILTVFNNMGILANGRVKKVNNIDYYIIEISGKTQINNFANQIGFLNHPTKIKRLAIEVKNSKKEISNTNKILSYNIREKILEAGKDLVKNHGWSYRGNLNSLISTVMDKRISKNGRKKDLSIEKLKIFIEAAKDKNYIHKDYLTNISNLHFEMVQSIKESESQVYDFTVPETHSFVANGLVNHNTAGLKTAVEAVNDTHLAVALSGKASNVLSQNGLEAATIHRALIFDPVKGGFKHNEHNPIHFVHTFILDEASMVDNRLLLQLLQAIPNGSQLLIVGDSGQLPAIGRGATFDYLLNTTEFEHVTLTEVHRQAQDSGTLKVANMVRDGKQFNSFTFEGTEVYGNNKDFYSFGYTDKSLIVNDLLSVVERYVNNPNKDKDDLQIITGLKEKGNTSVVNLNKMLQPIFNPENEAMDTIKGKTYEFRLGDRVIQQGNKYKALTMHLDDFNNYANGFLTLNEIELGETQVFNGTFGKIIACAEGYGILVEFEDVKGTVFFEKSDQNDEIGVLDLGYAISCHRSQGSGFKTLFMVLSFSDFMLLSRQFLYTGLTRTINQCFLFAETKAVHYAIKTDKGKSRKCYIGEFLK